MPRPIPVVYDVNILVNALKQSGDPYEWPSLPPRTPQSAADCIGVVNDHREFSLWLSPHILDNTKRVLMEAGLSVYDADEYLDVIEEIAIASGGDVVSPPRTVHDCPDFEDNLVLDLAAYSGAMILVSEDTDLTSMSPWRGTPVLRAREFAARVDASRRAEQRRDSRPTTKRLQQRTRRREPLSHPAPQTAEATPELFTEPRRSFQERRDQFADDLARLREIVGGWNPGSETMKPRIEVWTNNLTQFDARIARIDQVADLDREVAGTALEELNSKLTFALDRLDPRRANQRHDTEPVSHRAAPVQVTPHKPDTDAEPEV